MKYDTRYLLKNVPSNQIDKGVFVRVACSMRYKKAQNKEEEQQQYPSYFLIFYIIFRLLHKNGPGFQIIHLTGIHHVSHIYCIGVDLKPNFFSVYFCK
jgi:hypothetical protein